MILNTTQKLSKENFCILQNKIYNEEKSSLMKLAPKLTFKSVYPSNIEKQNVNLALKMFNVNNDITLKSLGDEIDLIDYNDTIRLIQIIREWLNIVNISYLNKGHYKNYNDNKPQC